MWPFYLFLELRAKLNCCTDINILKTGEVVKKIFGNLLCYVISIDLCESKNNWRWYDSYRYWILITFEDSVHLPILHPNIKSATNLYLYNYAK